MLTETDFSTPLHPKYSGPIVHLLAWDLFYDYCHWKPQPAAVVALLVFGHFGSEGIVGQAFDMC